MAIDLSKLSDADLAALDAGDLSKVSDAGLAALEQATSGKSSYAKNAFTEGRRDAKATADFFPNLAFGAAKGASNVGLTVYAPVDIASDAIDGKGFTLDTNRARRDAVTKYLVENGADPNSLGFKIGQTGAEVGATWPVGGALKYGMTKVAPELMATSPVYSKLANAVGSYGMRTGAPEATTLGGKVADLGIRSVGGGITGGVTAGMINPQDAATGFQVGAGTPSAIKAVGGAGRYIGNAAGSFVKPFTDKGQNDITVKILKKFGEGGNMTPNTQEYIAGSIPTLAEATGNAGIARLQSTAKDINPNAFATREAQNNAARETAITNLAGDKGQLEFYRASRETAADDLYKAALDRNPEATTPYIKGQITQLLKRPSIQSAIEDAKKLALERGEKFSDVGNLRSLHDVKTALDDQIGKASIGGQKGQVKALQATKAKLLDVMEKLSPEYKEARITYAEMSKPINQMEALQGLNLTDSKGTITLAKVDNAIRGLEKLRDAKGVNAAKSLTEDQLNVLRSLREDLLRQSNLAAGKSAGSNTFQNIATDNILNSVLPFNTQPIINGGVGNVLGQVGKLVYSGPNEQIRTKLVNALLDPQAATVLMKNQPKQIIDGRLAKFLKRDDVVPVLPRVIVTSTSN